MNFDKRHSDQLPDDPSRAAAVAELEAILERVERQTATTAERQRLNALLVGEPDCRTSYLAWMRLHAELSWHFAPAKPLTADELLRFSLAEMLIPDESLPEQSELGNQQSAPSHVEPAKSPVLGFLGGVVDYVNNSRRLMFLLVAVMLSGWFIFQVGSVLLGRWWAGDPQVANRAADVNGAAAKKPDLGGLANGTEPAHGTALAWLSGSVGGRWQVVAVKPTTGSTAEPAFWEIGTEFAPGRQVKLVAGLAEITFRSGAKVVVSAPARFSVTSALATDLQLGKLTARVPHDSSHNGPSRSAATGFTVSTPAGNVVDLGTEFGVEVTPDRRLDVQVFVGAVEVSSGGTGAGDAGEPGVRVTEGNTAHVEPGKPATIVASKEADKNRFERDLKIASDSGDKQIAAYLDFIRQLKPVLWLRMEGKEGDKSLHDEATSGEAASAETKLIWDGPGNPFVNGRVGKSLWLRGPKLKDCAIVADYPKAEQGKLSVVAWVYADSRPNFATIAKNWYTSGGRGQFHFGLVSAFNPDDGGYRPDSVDLGVEIAQGNGETVAVREGESHPFPLHEWQHVAFVTDGATLRLYRQGREVAAAKHDGLRFPVAIKSLGVGVKTGESGEGPDEGYPGYWSGRLDEIAIFNAALTADDIKKLAAGPPR